MAEISERRRLAIDLFEPLGPTYDRYAHLLSFGQDPRWRRFLVQRIDAGPADRVLDVATGTGAVALELLTQKRCSVVGIDQSPGMLAEARRRVPPSVELIEGDADHLPFDDASFDGLTFTYLLRYVDDPEATLAELARVVKPGASLAGLEFGIPQNPFARAAWEAYVHHGLPLAGRLIAPEWAAVGGFLESSVKSFWERYPLERQLALWRGAGLEHVRVQRLTFGGGLVMWGRRRD
jgi:demethylmenaquinone methyltransferase/2-methoxy-6-polyprenyl-1,4-benzoquinol methylase